MLKILKWVHQFPQCLIGFFMTRRPKSVKEYKDIKVYFTNNVFGCGVSLGEYIILDESYNNSENEQKTIQHEYGHHRQSLYLGWLYLLIVGLPSAVRNIWDRVFHKNWLNQEREIWYYTGYPEAWADKLGDVNRFGETKCRDK